jgi:hypothetical protein
VSALTAAFPAIGYAVRPLEPLQRRQDALRGKVLYDLLGF